MIKKKLVGISNSVNKIYKYTFFNDFSQI